jgi:hypothetical protein
MPREELAEYIEKEYMKTEMLENYQLEILDFDLELFFIGLIDYGHFKLKKEVLNYSKAMLEKIQTSEQKNIMTILAKEKAEIKATQMFIINRQMGAEITATTKKD